jgi:CRP-like cAMP-binding protein
VDETLSLMEKVAFLKSIEMYSNVPTEALAQLAARGREYHFEAGDVIFREGDANRGAFLVVEGLVEIRKGRALDSIRTAAQGFGELGLKEGEPHHFTATAMQHTHVLNLSNEDMLDAMLDHAEVGVAMVRGLARRLSGLAQRVHDLEGQIAHLNATLSQAKVDVPTYQSGLYRRPDVK